MDGFYIHAFNMMKNMIKYTDDELIKGCLLKNPRYQEYLYNKYYNKMMTISKRYCNNTEDAEDVLSECFLKIFEKLDEFNNNGSFEGWIKRIVHNTSLNYIRTNMKLRNNINIEDNYTQVEYNAPNALDIMSEKELLKLIDTLPPGYKQIFKLYEINQFKHHEIAKKMDISINTSKSQLTKARRWLKQRIFTV